MSIKFLHRPKEPGGNSLHFEVLLRDPGGGAVDIMSFCGEIACKLNELNNIPGQRQSCEWIKHCDELVRDGTKWALERIAQ